MENKKIKKYLKIIITCVIVGLFVWFLLLRPYLQFKGNEDKFLKAAKRYYEVYPNELPSGSRVGTVTLKELAHKSFLTEDLYVPYSNDTCSIEESWVKVRKEDGEYKYYTYLKCGVLSSIVDHKGPEITLKGEEEITINKGEEYEELGVESVVDNSDGKMSTKDVVIDSSEVKTDQIGTYEVKYTIADSLDNETVKIRTVNVVQRLKNTVLNDTENTGVYTGTGVSNYIRFSNILFRIIDVDGDNVRIVTSDDIANVNYDAIDDWLEYFKDHLTDEAKKYLVENTHCTDTLTEENVSTTKECSSNSKANTYNILSAQDINKTLDEAGESYLYPATISWLANSKNEEEAWATKIRFINYDAQNMVNGQNYMAFDKDYNFGIRPVLTIKGDEVIKSGDGTEDNPYSLEETTKGKANDNLNTRYSGEYLEYSGYIWRIMEVAKDNSIKVIMEDTLQQGDFSSGIAYETTDESKIYDPTQRGNIGYVINQKTGDYINSGYFVNKKIEVPIYKNLVKYNEESTTKEYTVRFAAPNMYEMFTSSANTTGSYWLINSSREVERKYMVSDNGVVYYDKLSDRTTSYARIVGYLNKNCKILSGSGTKQDPYQIVK